MSLSDLITHDEMRRRSMTRAKYLARIGKIRTFEKLNAAGIIADRYNDAEARNLILVQRDALTNRQRTLQQIREGIPARGGFLPVRQGVASRQRSQRDTVRGVVASGTLEIDWAGYEAAQQEEREEVGIIESLARRIIYPAEAEREPAIRQIRFRKKGGE